MVQLKSAEIIYPESDGKPIADNTKQFRLIVGIEQNLEQLYATNPNVFATISRAFWEFTHSRIVV